MVTRNAWIPTLGTYSVEATNEVYNPTTGNVCFTSSEPKDISETTEKELKSSPISPAKDISSNKKLQEYLNIAALANLATVEQSDERSDRPGEWKGRGAPTEIAVEVFASRFEWGRASLTQGTNAKWVHVAEFPFDSDVKKMSVLFNNDLTKKTYILTKVRKYHSITIC